MEERCTGHNNEYAMTSWGYKMSPARQFILRPGSVPKVLQAPGAAVPSCPFKNMSPSSSRPVMEWVMCWRRNDHSEQHQAAAIRMAQICCETGTDVCRQAGLQTNIEKNISGSWEVLYLRGLGTEQIAVVPERHILCQVVKRYPEQASFCWEWAGNSRDRREVEVHWITSVLEGTPGSLLHFVMSDWGDPGSLTTFWFQLSKLFQPRKDVNVFTFYNKETTAVCLAIPLVMQWAAGLLSVLCTLISLIYQEVRLTGVGQWYPVPLAPWAGSTGEVIWSLLDLQKWSVWLLPLILASHTSKQANCIRFAFLFFWPHTLLLF